MKYLTGKDHGRIPLFVGCLEEAIEADNEVRFLDAFVEALLLGDFEISMIFTAFKLRRIFNLLPQNVLQAYLKGLGQIIGFKNSLLYPLGFDLSNAGSSRTIVRIIFVPLLQPAKIRYIRC